MNTINSRFKTIIARPEFWIAWVLLAVALGAFLTEVAYLPLFINLIEAGALLVVVILAFAIAYGAAKANTVVEGGRDGLDSLATAIADPLIMYDVDFKVTFFNAAAEQLFHLNAATVIGHVLSPSDLTKPGWERLIQTVFPSLAPRVIAISREGERPQVSDLSFSDPDLELRVISSPILDHEGRPTAFIKIAQDQTAQAAALRSKTEFVTIASHQFRGPMTDISWALQTLASDTGMSDTSKLIVSNALAASQGLIRRIEDLLNVAKMEEGRGDYSFEDADVAEFVGKVILEVLPAARKAGIKIYFDRPTESLPHVMIDPRQMSIVLINLLENAIRYNIENGEVFVRIDRAPEKPFVRVSVRDTGIGIPREAMDKLFKKFFRADNALQFQTEGSGLGLYIAKNIVNAHGGDMTVESELGRGTVISFTLPTDPALMPKNLPIR
jgi:signal transduction histidine kinase